jgi:hypothetical protein
MGDGQVSRGYLLSESATASNVPALPTELLQAPKPASPGLRSAVIDGDVVRYVPIAGTHGWRDEWCMNNASAFAVMLAQAGFSKIVTQNSGRPFRWSTDLNGPLISLKFWDRRNSDWEAGADALFYFLDAVSYRDRNLIAHSHGGQVALIAASWGLEIRSLTTVGTPVRNDVAAGGAEALAKIGFWQHIHDSRFDFIALGGQFGDLKLDADRAFDLPGVLNRGIAHVSHSKVLRDERFIPFWAEKGWLKAIRESRAEPAVA